MVGGEETSNEVEIAEAIQSHWEDLNKPHNEDVEGDKQIFTEYSSNTTEQRNILGEKVTVEEVTKCISLLKNGKAEGEDEIPNEFIKKGGLAMADSLQIMYNRVIKTKFIPHTWKNSYTKLLHKGGDSRELDNYRGIAVTSNVGKLFTKIIANRLEGDIEERGLLGKTQYGFRKGKRATDAIFMLTQVIEQKKKRGKKLGLAFLDIRKAYDRVWRRGLWETMEKKGYGGGGGGGKCLSLFRICTKVRKLHYLKAALNEYESTLVI